MFAKRHDTSWFINMMTRLTMIILSDTQPLLVTQAATTRSESIHRVYRSQRARSHAFWSWFSLNHHIYWTIFVALALFYVCALFSDEVHVLKSPKVERRYLARSLGAYEINVRRWEIKIIGFILFIGWSICSDSQINMRLCGILRRQLDDSWQSGSRTTGANLDEYIFWTRSKR